jgi:O-antigen/teichoic acid export membrane protein
MDKGPASPPSDRPELASQIASSIGQVVISTLIVLLLYRYVVEQIGIEGLGAWSLILAIGSVVQLGSLALPAAVTRLVAEHRIRGDVDGQAATLATGVALTSALSLLLAVLAFPLGKWFLGFSLTGDLLARSSALVGPALLAFVLALVTGAYQAGLYGAGRIGLRNSLLVVDSIAHAAACVALVGEFNLAGLVWARVLTNGLLLAVTMVVTHQVFPAGTHGRMAVTRASATTLVEQGLKLQAISLLVLAAEPVTKALLGRFGSASLVGYFEMANRLVQALRSLFVAANQVTLPRYAATSAAGEGATIKLFYAAHRLNWLAAVPAFATLVAAAPVVSWLWLGDVEASFVGALMLLGLGWLTNVVSIPAYFASLGTGQLRPNLISHVVMSLVNVGGGAVLGLAYGGTGVQVAWLAALCASSVILLLMFFGRGAIAPAGLVPEGQRLAGGFLAVVMAVAFLLFGPAAAASPPALGASAGLTAIVVVAALAMLAGSRVRSELAPLLGDVLGRRGQGV